MTFAPKTSTILPIERAPDVVPMRVARPQHGRVQVSYASTGTTTYASRIHESGTLRLRHPRASSCQGVLVNTGGGILGGDQLAIDVTLGRGAAVTLTSVAAEKVYRSEGEASTVTARLSLAGGSRLVWIPQETILFDRARLRRQFEIDLADDAHFVSAEMVVFGRTAYGECGVSGAFHDSWRLRRSEGLVFADETSIEGPIGAILDRPAVGNGARAMATVLVAGPGSDRMLETVRAVLASHRDEAPAASFEGGASLREGIIIARLLARSAERLRAAVGAMLGALEDVRMPRLWL